MKQTLCLSFFWDTVCLFHFEQTATCQSESGKDYGDNAMAITQKNPATADQIKQLNRFATDAVEKAIDEFLLSHGHAQKILEKGDVFVTDIYDFIQKRLFNLSVTDMHSDEEVESDYGYLFGYQVRPLNDQLNCLKKFYPELEGVEVIDPGELPDGAEGWFVVPNIWRFQDLPYADLVEKALSFLKNDRGGQLYYEEPLCIRQSTEINSIMGKVSEEQGNPEVLVIACQFGIAHRGRSPCRAYEVMLNDNQYGLGAFVVATMLLTHPNRLVRWDELNIYCVGDIDARDDIPSFCFKVNCDESRDGLYFLDEPKHHACDEYGSVSGFLSKKV